MSNELNLENKLTADYPYEVHRVRDPNGELVWVQKGINPDNIYNDKRRSDWPYSNLIADQICIKIVEGESLTAICKQEGFPSYSVVCRWRNEYPLFKANLELAYKDRAEFYLEKILDLVDSVDEDTNLGQIRLRIDALKWAAATAVSKEQRKKQSLMSIVIAND